MPQTVALPPLVTFEGAAVQDVEERGRLQLYAGGPMVGSMPASAGAIEALTLKTVVVEGGVLAGKIETVDEHIGNTDLYHASASASFDG